MLGALCSSLVLPSELSDPRGGITPILRTDPKSEASSSAVWEPPQAGLTLSPPSPHQAHCAPSAILGSLQSPQPRGV